MQLLNLELVLALTALFTSVGSMVANIAIAVAVYRWGLSVGEIPTRK